MEIPWKLALGTLYLILGIVRIIYLRRYDKKVFSKVFDPTRQTLIVHLVNLTAGPLTLILIFSDFLSFAQIGVFLPLQIIGIFIFALGILLLWWTHSTLGLYFSPIVELRTDHALLQSGPYARIRHPMYTSVLLVILGGFLISANWLYFICQLSVFIYLCVVRIPAEEKALIEKFGSLYQDYQARTGQILPFI